jgi:hypothetical protein
MPSLLREKPGSTAPPDGSVMPPPVGSRAARPPWRSALTADRFVGSIGGYYFYSTDQKKLNSESEMYSQEEGKILAVRI